MQCPSCGVSVFAEASTCRDCGWVLSQPYQPASRVASPEPERFRARPSTVELVELPAPRRMNGHRPSGLNPPSKPRQQRLWDTLGSSLGRRRARAHRTTGIPNDAVVELTPEAYFASRPRAIECLEMPLVQTTLDFSTSEAEEEPAVAHRMAPLEPRLRAGLYDAALILLASGIFFGLFAALGGQLGLARRDLLIYGIATFAQACLYFALFTYFGGETPGMRRYALTPVRFDGGPLTPQDARLRAFGYVVSTGSLLVGFLWAAADEQQLTWHDRISRTLLVSLPSHGPKPVG